MKRYVIGILAHVDSGKTTLAEALLYTAGAVRKLGRVDHRDSFLDNNIIERDRGITIISKQAVFEHSDTSITLLDTPGHVDFSGETERTLSVLDAAILVISGTDGVQSHTRTLISLLNRYSVPTFVFVNKCDMQGFDKLFVRNSVSAVMADRCVDFSQPKDDRDEELSLCCEELMSEYIENGSISVSCIRAAVADCKLVPCFYGSALRLQGIDSFLDEFIKYLPEIPANKDLSAIVYKLSQDESGNLLTHMKITGGELNVRDVITYTGIDNEEKSEKIQRIRIYNGEKFTFADKAVQGEICAVSGLSDTYIGLCIGSENGIKSRSLKPPLIYAVKPNEKTDEHTLLKALKILEREDPELAVDYDQSAHQITASFMGEVQAEVFTRIVSDRFGFNIGLGDGKISYRETIAAPAEGAGHFEPLRHYAEVHLRLEPLPRGRGFEYVSECSEDTLAKNWQRLIMTHLKERVHKGVLTCSPITDIRFVLTAGKAHIKHTEGGDFRQATYRAVRNALRYAENVLLEPYYSFRLEVPSSCTGRALTDLERAGAVVDPLCTEGVTAVITGKAPVSVLRSYHTDVAGYTKGEGSLSVIPVGYDTCLNSDDVISDISYDPDRDTVNTADSVFCTHGAGYVVPWDEAKAKMHVSPYKTQQEYHIPEIRQLADTYVSRAAADEELRAIFERTYGKIERKERYALHTPKETEKRKPKPSLAKTGPEFFLIDGYNVIFAWEELKALSKQSLDLARASLIDRLCNYQGFYGCEVILVFDAYKVKEPERCDNTRNITVIYTKEAETADTYIEKAAHKLSKENRVRVVTSDGLEQIIIMGSGALRISADEFHSRMTDTEKAIRESIEKLNSGEGKDFSAKIQKT